ncbi:MULTISPECIES: fimbrial-like protein [Enterobacteriaceae]|uniref:fimbrial-like protein n=1 Tax=Enterobacteriaceae TaxID=543 RepID=UPI001D026089|nr:MULTISPECIES: fimbrial-like protein [Enterobacteriaceae]ELD0444947.1 fimbrial protein [Escherichia coli]ELS8095996.1 fimbrial protein [Escherichia coli]MCB5821595.1 fimbrial protein [Shigella sonnei]MCB6858555.1 fimbrial protein [Escherichia coli]
MLFRHHNFVLLLGLVSALCSPVGYTNQDVDLTANIVSSTCQVTVNNNGVVDLGTVTLDYFADNITPETDYAGGKNFTVDVVSCDNLQTTQSQIKLDFQPQTGSLTQGNLQVFSNQYELQPTGAKNVGVAIFSAQPNKQKFNVRGTDGTSKAIYSVPSNQVIPSTWTFYSRMQRVNNSLAPVAGIVRSQVIVNVYYE